MEIMKEDIDKKVQNEALEAEKRSREARNVEVATDMIKEGGMSAALISKISKLSEESVRKLAKTLRASVL